MQLIDADELSIKIIEEMKEAVKWGITAIADGEKEFILKAEQAVESFCKALLLVKEMPTIYKQQDFYCPNCGADMRGEGDE